MRSRVHGKRERVSRVGTWWNPDHQLDIVGLDEQGRAAILGEAKWHTQPFTYQEAERASGDSCCDRCGRSTDPIAWPGPRPIRDSGCC